MGINNALEYAYDNGYTEVIFPRGEYSICYPNPITTFPNLTINFNFSTFKVLYDSINRSPLDKSDDPIYFFGGTSILCRTQHTHIKNLYLIGDRIDRTWTSQNTEDQKKMEQTIGVKFAQGSNRSTIRNCNISHYMADAIYISFGPYSDLYVTEMEMGSIDALGNKTTTNGNTVRSKNTINLPLGMKSFAMIGIGYAPQTSIPNRIYNVYFYNDNEIFIARKQYVRTRDTVQIPNGATKIKLVWDGDGTTDGGTAASENPPYWTLLIQNGISDNVIVEYNEIHRCHRGGIFLGGNNVTIRKNFIHNTGDPRDFDIDGTPNFNDFTRYGITSEDNVGHNCKISDNVFENVRMAIAMRGEFNDISSNEFRDCTFGMVLYNQRHLIAHNNYFHYSGILNFEYENMDRNWDFRGNIFSGSNVSFSGSGTFSNFSYNHFSNGSIYSSLVRVLNFEGNTFDASKHIVLEMKTVIDGCSYLNDAELNATGNEASITKRIYRCKFINSIIKGQNISELIIRDSFLDESSFEYSSGSVTYKLLDCEVVNTDKPVIGSRSAGDIGEVTHNLELIRCDISLGKNPIIEAFSWGDLTIEDTKIVYNLNSNYDRALHDTYGNIQGEVIIKESSISALGADASHELTGYAKFINITDRNEFKNFTII